MAFGLDDAIATGLKIIDKFVPDPQAKIAAEKDLRDSLKGWDDGQLKVNEAEATNANVFVAGWRPAIGWCCAFAVGYTYILVPVGMWVGFIIGKPIPKPPVLDGNLWELMFAMLGMSGLRTFEKIKGFAPK
jgi:hypothetical protein